MPTILICTDFSDSSRNAVSYICKMATSTTHTFPVQYILYHLFEIPASYSGNGISLTTLDREINLVEENLKQECISIRELYPHINISPKLSTASYLKTGLENDIIEIEPYLVVIGAGGNYSDLLTWDKEIISIIRELSVPVLVIPKNVSYSPVKRIAFACNLKNVNRSMPFHLIIRLINFTGGELYVLFVKGGAHDTATDVAENMVKENLSPVNPVYFTVTESNIVNAVSSFVKENEINVLFVTPRKHGIWQSIIFKNNAKELVKLNAVPILALRQEN